MTSTAPIPIPFVGAFESTYQPAHDRDVAETTQHVKRWREDLGLLLACKVGRLRYPVRWHRIESVPGVFDWAHLDEVLGFMRDEGLKPIVDLLHHTSYPRWLGDLTSPAFEPAFLRFVEAVATRYPWLPAFTVCNEPFTTFLLCGHEGVWPPYLRGLAGFVKVATNVLPAVARASRALHDLLPGAEHVHVEVCEHHSSSSRAGAEAAAMANDRRFLMTDLLIGLPVTTDRPFVAEVLRAGGDALLSMPPGLVDVLGLDYYAHNQWHWSAPRRGTNVSPAPLALAQLVAEYADRYRLPCILGETNIRGLPSDRATWLKYTLEQCELARDAGVPLRGYCWFPFVDSTDWNSLLRDCAGSIDPVGVFSLDSRLDRTPSSMSAAYAMAAGGAPASTLPAYTFGPPVAERLAGWLPQMRHWQWSPPPASDRTVS